MADSIPKDPPAGSAEAWLPQLLEDLGHAQPTVTTFENLYDGKHGLHFATTKFRETFGDDFAPFADNWCQIIVDAAVERLVVEGFRFGEDSADKDARDIWQANQLDAESDIVHTEAGKHGRAFLLVAPGEDDRWPSITGEHPSQMIVKHAAGSRRKRVAALKRWLDDDGYLMATVYMPDEVVKFRSADAVDNVEDEVVWTYRNGDRGGSTDTNPLEIVPVIPIYNKPGMLRDGCSDLEPAHDLNRAIDKLVLDGIVASEFAAFRQRVLTGIEIPTDENGRPIDEERFISSVSRVWTIEETEGVGVHEFSATDLSNFVVFIDMLVQHLSAQTRTPPHYLLSKMANLSGDALQAAESGLFFKVTRKQRGFSESWEEALRLAFKLRDQPGDAAKAQMLSAETIWHDAQNRSLAQLVDAAGKLAAQLQVPLSMCWEIVGMTPLQIERATKLLGDHAEHVPAPTTGKGGLGIGRA